MQRSPGSQTVAPSPLATRTRSESGDRRLIVMTRIPEAGRVKTRLIPVLGAAGAAALHARLLERTLATGGAHSETSPVTVELRYAGDTETPLPIADDARVSICRPQQGTGLGERLEAAVACAVDEHARAVVVIGTDCPDLTAEILALAWQKLQQADVVFGPARDGGYYLVGVKKSHRELFHDIDWGTSRVLAQSLAKCRQLGLSVALLPVLSDVDCPEDLITCRRIGGGIADALPRSIPGMLSVIIPVLNEVQNLESAITPLLNEPDCEVIVSDGGSTDGTAELAEQLGCRLIRATRGRGQQLNAGAALARGEFLLFLHADTRLPACFREEIGATLATGAIAGAFRFQLDQSGWCYRIIEWGTNLRSRYLQLPYGDQGLFLRTSDFFSLNGFQNWPFMEDFEFSRRLKRHGDIRICLSAAPTSARRWKRRGVFQTTLMNQVCITLYLCGVSPISIAKYYQRWRK